MLQYLWNKSLEILDKHIFNTIRWGLSSENLFRLENIDKVLKNNLENFVFPKTIF